MSEANTPSPLGIDLNTAQNAIRAMIAPEEDTATTTEALEADEAEMPEDDASYEEYSELMVKHNMHRSLKNVCYKFLF